MLAHWKKSYDQPRQHIKKQRHYFANKGPSSQSCGFPSSHVWIWELDYKGSWVPKNWCFWTVVLEKTLESPLDCKEIQPFHSEGNQSWIFTGRTDAEAEILILWPSDMKNQLIGRAPDAGKDWGREEKGTTEGAQAGPEGYPWVCGHHLPGIFGWSRCHQPRTVPQGRMAGWGAGSCWRMGTPAQWQGLGAHWSHLLQAVSHA